MFALAVTDRTEAWPRGATPRPRSGAAAERSYPTSDIRAVAERSNPTSKEQWLRGHRRAERSYSTFKVRGAAVRRYPSSKVRSSGCTLLEQSWRDTPW